MNRMAAALARILPSWPSEAMALPDTPEPPTTAQELSEPVLSMPALPLHDLYPARDIPRHLSSCWVCGAPGMSFCPGPVCRRGRRLVVEVAPTEWRYSAEAAA